ELFDLFAERGDVFTRFSQRRREALVLRDGLRELTLCLEHPLFEGADAFRRVLEPAAEDDDLFLDRLQLRLQVADEALVFGEAPVVLGSPRAHLHSWRGPAFGGYTGTLSSPCHVSGTPD